jgi:hypothetical protein
MRQKKFSRPITPKASPKKPIKPFKQPESQTKKEIKIE